MQVELKKAASMVIIDGGEYSSILWGIQQVSGFPAAIFGYNKYWTQN